MKGDHVMADLTQAVYLEHAVRALENRDRPALVGALASLDTDTLDHLATVIFHPVWAHLLADPAAALHALEISRD
jgi:hypothetical protein